MFPRHVNMDEQYLCYIRGPSDMYLDYKRKPKIFEKWRFISQHSLFLVRYT